MFWKKKKKELNIENLKVELLESLKVKLYKEYSTAKPEDDPLFIAFNDDLVTISQRLLKEEVKLFCEDLDNSQAIIKLFEGTMYQMPNMSSIKGQASATLFDYLLVTTRINTEANSYVFQKQFNEKNKN
jgi:hypothetical protein